MHFCSRVWLDMSYPSILRLPHYPGRNHSITPRFDYKQLTVLFVYALLPN